MATADIRLKRIENEYQSVRGVQDDILDRMDRLMAHLEVPPKPPAGFVKE